MTEWNIQSRGHACVACTRTFADKEHYHSLLFDEKSDFHRLDICEACWQTQYSQGARERKGFVSYWQGVYEAPAPQAEPIQKENAETLLRKLMELKDPKYGPAAFILAVMLERKRLLKVREQLVRDGRRIFVYEHSKSGDVFTIADPDLHLNELEQVQHDVANLLEHGLSAGPASPAPGPAEASREISEPGLATAAESSSAPVDEESQAPQTP